jgi:cytochrome c553
MTSARTFRRCRRTLFAPATAVALLVASAGTALALDFLDALARVDEALRQGSRHSNPLAVKSCRDRRNYAVLLYDNREVARAERSLKYCFEILGISDAAPVARDLPATPDMEAIRAEAALELEGALELTPNIENGLEVYRDCALCHQPEGWGLLGGLVPQVAGQHRTVVIKQLADIRAGHRDAMLMLPYASVEAIGGTQAVADVAGYIDTLEMTVENGKGLGKDLELGEQIYRENCARCHGASGEGSAKEYVPRIHAQHYHYLVGQFEKIRSGKRRNANPEMLAQIQGFDERQTKALLDYVSRLQPPEELQAPAGWYNPDFGDPNRN